MPRKAKTVNKVLFPTSEDDLQALADNDKAIIALLLWKQRLHNPTMTVLIEEKDLIGIKQCIEFLKIEPQVFIERDKGVPEQPGRNHGVIPAIPPRPMVTVSLVERGTRNAIRPLENNQQDFARAQALRDAKANAKHIASTLVAHLNSGTLSSSTIEDAAQALMALSQ